MKIIFIHGNNCLRWDYAWTPWLKAELDKLGVANIFETFPDSIIARAQYWLPFLKENLKTDEQTILVGHSSGATAAMRYAEKNKILGSVLIGPSYTDLGAEIEKQSGYFDGPWQWEKIKANQKFIGLFYSTDDPYIPVSEFEEIKNRLSASSAGLMPKTFAFTNRGHFMDETFPELLEYLKSKL